MFSAASRGIPSFGDLSWKRPCKGVASSDPTISASVYLSANVGNPASATPGFGQTLTASANGSLNSEVIFGGSGLFVVGDRLLIGYNPNNAQATTGIFVVTNLGSAITKWVLTRATDDDSVAEHPAGSTVPIMNTTDVTIAYWGAQFVLIDSGIYLPAPRVFDDIHTTGGFGGSGFGGPVTLSAGMFSDASAGDGLEFSQPTASIHRWDGNAFREALTPAGVIVAYGGAAAPSGWLLCNGASVLRTDYPALFTAIGTTYGSVDGTHFTLPDLRGRFPLGKAAAGTGSTLGGTGGTLDHTHTSTAHAHSHNHQLAMDTSGSGYTAKSTPNWGQGAAFTGNRNVASGAVSVSAHWDLSDTDATSTTPGATGSNNPPFQVVNYIIKL